MIYTPEMMRTLARQHDEDSDTRAALMQAADKIERYETAFTWYATAEPESRLRDAGNIAHRTLKGE